MSDTITPNGPQEPVDLLLEMLRVGRAPMLGALLALAPEEPIGPPEGGIMVQKRGGGWVPGERKCWPRSVLDLHEQFPGYQPGYLYRESLKYGTGLGLPQHAMPAEDAPLSAFVRKRLQHARALWSAEISGGRLRLQFGDWLPCHVNFQTLVAPLWPDGGPGPESGLQDGWARSFRIVRLASGLLHLARHDPRSGRP